MLPYPALLKLKGQIWGGREAAAVFKHDGHKGHDGRGEVHEGRTLRFSLEPLVSFVFRALPQGLEAEALGAERDHAADLFLRDERRNEWDPGNGGKRHSFRVSKKKRMPHPRPLSRWESTIGRGEPENGCVA
jgi:hypothetical protein